MEKKKLSTQSVCRNQVLHGNTLFGGRLVNCQLSDGAKLETLGEISGVKTMPTPSADNLGKIYQYIGATTANYTNGYFYKCTVAGSIYSWSRISVQPAGSASWGEITGSIDSQTDLQSRFSAVEADVAAINVDNMGDAHAKSMDMDELPKVCGFPMFIFGTAAPAVTPDFIGQMFIDTTNSKVYCATGVANAASFKALN